MLDNKNILLYPFSMIYGFITSIRNFLYNTEILPSVEFEQPVICVGNISVGGTGKTPHTEYLVDLLQKDFKVATLSRGYKRKTRNFRIASSSSQVSDIGDEPMQLKRKFPNILVAVDRKRVHGTKNILDKHPETEAIILDDAFQHRSITPGFSILLSEYGKLMTRDHMMPYGSLRESVTNMRRADIILITKSPADITPIQRRLIVKEVDKAPYQNLYFTSLIYKNPIAVFDMENQKKKQLEISECSNCSIVLISGIANPLPLEKYLQDYVGEIILLPFPDHYNYKEKDIITITTAFNNLKSQSKYLITTEKDAVRLREFTNIAESIKSAFYYIPVGIHFLNDDKDEFDNIIVNYVRKNKRNNRVSEI
jgi:tetraacyldisaccharide 4'-kinase